MDKNDETVQKILADKPVRPTLQESNINERQVKELEQFKSKCERKSRFYIRVAFVLISSLAALVIVLSGW